MMFGEEPGKQKTRSCRTQELARSSAQEMSGRKRPRTGLSKNRARARSKGAKLKRRKVGRRVLFEGATRWDALKPDECTISLRVVSGFRITSTVSRLRAKWPQATQLVSE